MGTKVYTSKSSVKVFGDNTEDVVQKAKNRAVLNFVTTGERYYNCWVREVFMAKGQLLSYYRYAETGQYYLGLPNFTLKGVSYDEVAVAAALSSSLGGGPYTVLGIKENTLDIEMYWQHELQSAPYYYQPFINQITHSGNTDWEVTSIYYYLDEVNPGLEEYRVAVSRTPRDAKFWIEGPLTRVEGETATYTIHSNSWMPRACSTSISIAYSGTLGAGRYTAPTNVVMTELTNKVTFDIDFPEDAVDDGTDTLIITLSGVVDTNSAFTAVAPHAPLSSVTTTVYDNDPLVLEINSQLVSEIGLATITIPVTLSDVTAAPFTVDVLAVDGTAVQPTDYGLPPDTLNFAGTAGETHNIVATWIGDVPDETEKTFTVTLSNCSDPAVELVSSATVVVTSSIRAQPAVVLGTEVLDEISLPGTYEGNDEYMQVRYHDNTHNENRWYWWLYRIADNTYPAAHATYSTETIDDMYPVGVIRRQKVFTNDNTATEAYKDTRMLMRRIRMKIDDITDNVAEQTGYEDVDDVFVNFAFSPDDTHPLISKLLFHHFHNIIVNLAVTSSNGEYRTYFEQQDANNETIWYDQEFTDDLPGTIPGGTGVGSCSHAITSVIDSYRTEYFGDNDMQVPIYQDWLNIYYQKTETTYSYIKLRDLRATSQISYAGKTRYKVNGLVERGGYWGVPDVDAPEHLTIPLSRALIENYFDYEEQMIIYQHIFRIDFYSIQIVRTQWYESGFFKALFTFVAIIVTIYTAGAGATLFTILQTLIINTLILKLVVYIAEETGNLKLAVLIGIIATIALGNAGFGSGFDIGTADALTTSVSKFSDIYSAAGEGIINDMEEEYADIQSEIARIEAETEELYDSGVTGEYYRNMIKSADAMIMQGRDIQYNFDAMLGGAYNRLVTDFHENMLQPGIV